MKYTVKFGDVTSAVHSHLKGEYIADYLSKGSFYEEPLLNDLFNQYKYSIDEFVDVGANVGNHAVFFHDVMKTPRIHCFEPNERNFHCLKQSAPFATLHQVALSDKDGTVSSTPNIFNMGASYCTPGGDIPAKRLDDYDLHPDLIKIDAENMEVEVITGAVQTVRRSKPVLIVEHHDIQQFYKFNRVLKTTGVEYLVRPFVEETWEVFEYVPTKNYD